MRSHERISFEPHTQGTFDSKELLVARQHYHHLNADKCCSHLWHLRSQKLPHRCIFFWCIDRCWSCNLYHLMRSRSSPKIFYLTKNVTKLLLLPSTYKESYSKLKIWSSSSITQVAIENYSSSAKSGIGACSIFDLRISFPLSVKKVSSTEGSKSISFT